MSVSKFGYKHWKSYWLDGQNVPYLGVVKVLAIHSTVKNLPLMRDQKSSHTKTKGFVVQDGQDVPITSQISRENFEMIKELQKRRIMYVLVLRFTNLRLIIAAELGCLGQFKRSNQIVKCWKGF